MKQLKITLLSLSLIALSFSGWSFQTGIETLPNWCKLVFQANVTETMKHPLLSEFLNQDPDFNELKSELSQMGIDLTRDNILVTLGSAEIKDEGSEPDYIVHIDANHDESKVLSFLKNKAKTENGDNLEQETINGYTVLSSKKDKHFPSIALLQGRSIVLSSSSRIKEALNYVDGSGGKTVLDNTKLKSVINSVKGNNICWGVMEATDYIKNEIKNSAKPEKGQKPDPTLTKLAKVSQGWDAFQFFSNSGTMNNITLGSISKSSGNAAESTEALTSLLDQAKMMLTFMLPPDMNAIITPKLGVLQSGNAANIALSLSNDEIRDIKRILEEQNKPKSEPGYNPED